MKQLVTIGEAARILGVSVDTVRKLENAGELKAQRTAGNHRRFSLAALESFRKTRAEAGSVSERRRARSATIQASQGRSPTAASPRRASRNEPFQVETLDDYPVVEVVAGTRPASVSSEIVETRPKPSSSEPAVDPVREQNRLMQMRQYGLLFVPNGISRSYESKIIDTLQDYVTSERFPDSAPLYAAHNAIRAKVEAIVERYENELAGERRVEELIEHGRSRAVSSTSSWDADDREDARSEVLDELEGQIEEDWSESDVNELVDETLSQWENEEGDEEENDAW